MMKHLFAMLLLGAGIAGFGQDSGCGHPHACNYDADAIHDNDLCWFTCNVGCTNPLSCAFSEENLYHDGSCDDVEGCGIFVQCGILYCELLYESLDYDGDGWPDVPLLGCTDCSAANYAYCATEDDGSCYPVVLGCTLPFACNFNEEANRFEYDSCEFWSCYEGCTDETACNYDAEALTDDGSCEHHPYGTDYDCEGNCLVDGVGDGCCQYPPWDDFGGCSDPYACNFNPFCPDVLGGSNCHYPPVIWCENCACEITPYDCSGDLVAAFDTNDNDVVDCLEVSGCLDDEACNFNENATFDDGSCDYASCHGCTEEWACNYDANATVDDGSCVFVEDLGCEECVNGEVVFLDEDGDGCCDQKWNDFGCSDPSACNYSNPCGGSSWECYYPEPIWCDACECAITPYDCNGALLPGFDANDNGLVDCLETAGCLIGDACNFNSAATLDDASCEFESCLGCTDESSCNYDSEATIDDGSCYSCDIPASHCGEGTTWDTFTQTCVVSNPNDTDFDGCVGIADLLNLLSVFGTCAEPELDEWTCGDPLEYQGYDYLTVLIGEQCWFAENLRSENYLNGDAILSSLSGDEWSTVNVGAVSTFGEGESNCYNYSPNGDACNETWALSEYGRLYNWHATVDDRGLCPTDWHVSSDSDWLLLMEFLGGSFDAEMAMKTTTGWSNSVDGSNSSGFSGLPGGQRSNNLGNFNLSGTHGYWWSSSTEGMDAVGYYLSNLNEGLIRFAEDPRYGSSVRCIKDSE